jgi:hypothetical protein
MSHGGQLAFGLVSLLVAGCSEASPIAVDVGDAGSRADANAIVSDASSPGVDGSMPASNFAARCALPGVVRCVGFDDPSVLAGTWGDESGSLPGSQTKPTLDGVVRLGTQGSSLHFRVGSSSANAGGSWFTNFSSDRKTQFDSGATFWVQWRQRFDATWVAMNLASYGNAGWKQAIIGAGDKPGCNSTNTVNVDNGGLCTSSCTALEVVVQNVNHRGFPVMYNSCTGSTSTQNGRTPGGTSAYYPFEEPFGQYDFKLQNAMPAPYCLYSQGKVDGGYFPPKGNCFPYVADEWMTFKVKITVGQRTNDYFKGSHVDLWVAREGKPSVHVFDWTWDLAAGPADKGLAFGKVWLLPYNTNNGGNNNATVAEANTWYDELIVSGQEIPDPL